MTTENFLPVFEEYFKKVLSVNSPLSDAMLYASESGGKRLRPLAVYLGSAAFGKTAADDRILTLASAIEMIHGYSLVHDDLPAMDNDDVRRGKPSVHRAFGEANAILTGDRLLTLAAEILIAGSVGDATFAAAASRIALAAGEMADGQYYDLKGMSAADEFLTMYRMKTAALFEGAFTAGGIIGGANDAELEILSEYAVNFGVAFQIADDFADAGEISYVSIAGETGAKAKLSEIADAAFSAADKLAGGAKLIDFASDVLKIRP